MNEPYKRKSRKPDYKLKVLNKTTNQSAEIGAGWLNPNGSVSIVLNLCTVLTSDNNVVITLFVK
jgi:hypothetical protein